VGTGSEAKKLFLKGSKRDWSAEPQTFGVKKGRGDTKTSARAKKHRGAYGHEKGVARRFCGRGFLRRRKRGKE